MLLRNQSLVSEKEDVKGPRGRYDGDSVGVCEQEEEEERE